MNQKKFYTDMHCHIMPGVDDGAKDMDMSLKMLHIAADNHIRAIILTPHNTAAHRCVSVEGIKQRLIDLQQNAERDGIQFKLYPGNELFYDSTLPERLSAGQAMTLAGSSYALVEFDPSSAFSYIRDGLSAVSYEGFRPVLAHIERYQALLMQVDRAKELVRAGTCIQVNANAVVPNLFRPDTKFVNKLLREGLVHFVATDAHRDSGRAPYLKNCADYLYHKYEESYVDQLLFGHAGMVLQNSKI